MKCNYKIYIHICMPTLKIYVGMTRQELKKRWRNGFGYNTCTLLNRAIKKYGWNNFQHKLLRENLTKREAEEKERYFINLFKSNNPKYGYNIENGGNYCGKLSKKTIKKVSKILSKKFLGKNNPFYGKKHSKEAKEKMKKYRLGKPVSQDVKDKISKAFSNHHPNDVKVVCLENNIIYRSISEASRQLNVDASDISKICKGKRISTHGLHFVYFKDYKKG